MKAEEKRRVAEALILASSEPISAARLADILPHCTPGAAKDLVNQLNTEYVEQDRSFEIWEVAGGYQIRTRAEFSGYIQRLQKERPLRLSRAALETLAIVAYKQPATRAEIEQVRGVESGPVVRSLLDRQLIRIVGQREVPGRPMLYGTTKRFLELFGLGSAKDLPTLREFEELAREAGIGLGEDAEQDEATELAEAGAIVEAAEQDVGETDGAEATELAEAGAIVETVEQDAGETEPAEAQTDEEPRLVAQALQSAEDAAESQHLDDDPEVRDP